LAEVKKNK